MRFSGVLLQSTLCIFIWPADRAQNDLRRAAALGLLAACSLLTGGFRFMPCAFAERRPASESPPSGFFPADRCQAGVLYFFAMVTSRQTLANKEL